MSKQALQKMLALLFGFALVAAACGGSDGETATGSEDDTTETTEASEDDGEVGGAASEDEVAEAVEEAGEAEVSEGPTAGSIEELEEQWAAERAAIVETLSSGDYGLGDDGILRGPGGFEFDTSTCPADWNNDAAADGTITIGYTIAQSGALAVYGNIADGMGAYFDYLNANGGVGADGVQIELVVKDDEYVATRTQELVDELLQTEDPFAVTTLGSPNTFSVYNKLNELCVPHPMVTTGHQAWGDPEGHPWTTGQQLSYSTEALIWKSWIEDNLEGPVVVGGLVMDNDFGLAYESSFEVFAEESDVISEFVAVRHDPAAATLTNEVTTLAASNPDVFISMTAGNPCVLAIQEADRSGITETAQALFTPSVCKTISGTMEPAGDASEGWYVVGGGIKDTTDPQYADDPFIAWVNEQVEAAGLDSSVSLTGDGFGVRGWSMGQALLVAAELEGGLTRTNFILALRSMDMTHPALLDGIGWNTNGAEDSYFIEGSEISQFTVADQTWVQQGGIIDLSGLSPNCPWVPGEGC